MKRCPRCKQTKKPEEFLKNKGRGDGLDDYCKVCRQEKKNERYRVRRSALYQKMGGKCVRCGKLDELQFDHIDPEMKVYRTNSLSRYRRIKFYEEESSAGMLQLLCKGCHETKDEWTRQESEKQISA